MERHKGLYKENSSMLSPRQHNCINRKLVNANRAKKRSAILQCGRNIHMSPSPQNSRISATSTPAPPKCPTASLASELNERDAEDKENKIPPNLNAVGENLTVKDTIKDATRIVKLATTLNKEKYTRHEAFLLRFMEWKEKKKQIELQRKEQTKGRPFLTAVSASSYSSFVPQNHKSFKPPAGLKNPVPEKYDPFSKISKVRQSFYSVVPTPPKEKEPKHHAKKSLPAKLCLNSVAPNSTQKTSTISLKSNNALLKRKLSSNQESATKISGASAQKQPNPKKITPPNLMRENFPVECVKIQQKKVVSAGIKEKIKKSTEVNNPSKASDNGTIRDRIPPKSTSMSDIITKNITKTVLAAKKPTVQTLPTEERLPEQKEQKIKKENLKTAPSTGAIGKAKQLQNKAFKEPPPPQKNAKLAVNLKAKKKDEKFAKTAAIVGKRVPKNSKHNRDSILSVWNEAEHPADTTPATLSRMSCFGPSITSTARQSAILKKKACPKKYIKYEEISPDSSVLTKQTKTLKCPAKRTLLPESSTQTHENKLKQKITFVRYAVLDDTIISPDILCAKVNEEMVTQPSMPNGQINTINSVPEASLITPPQAVNSCGPSNYLSPYVSVSRGKVNARVEKEKRNSIYLVNEEENVQLEVESRRSLEAVRYYRQQLSDELKRLETLCGEWEQYKQTNLEHLQATSGGDMIDVTIGQTKLLASKKLMQFQGLIDRCEAGITGVGAVANDGSEKTKPITEIDLAGFWSMLGLQVENINKRFTDLWQWRRNNWVDPVEVKLENHLRKPLNKVRKPKHSNAIKAKPNSALQEMIRQAKANRQNKKPEEDIVIHTPQTRKRRSISGTPNSSGHKYVLVKDRKSRSSAATILSIPARKFSVHETGTPRSIKQSPMLQQVNDLQRSFDSTVDLLKYAIIGATNKKRSKSTHIIAKSPPQTPLRNGRKSILKTPGSVKGTAKKVVFNNELRVKKFKFTVDETESDDEECIQINGQNSDTENEANISSARTYGLRTRKVYLRPSSEFVIPK